MIVVSYSELRSRIPEMAVPISLNLGARLSEIWS